MNQEQRKFLIEQVTKTCKVQTDEIQDKMPIKPSLNNYLVAACLDNTLKLQDVDELKEKIRERVLKFGKDDLLVVEENESDWGYRRKKSDMKQQVSLEAMDIFVIPSAYLDALKEYEEKKSKLNEELKNMYAQRDTIIMKIQIGSNAVLDKLIMQVDSMGDLNLMNSQLMLGAETK